MPIRGNIHFHIFNAKKAKAKEKSINAHQGQYSFSSVIMVRENTLIIVSMPIRGNIHFHSIFNAKKAKAISINAHQGQYSFSYEIKKEIKLVPIVSMPIRGNIHFHTRRTQDNGTRRCINAHQGQYSFSLSGKALTAWNFEYQCPSGAIFIFIPFTIAE